MHHPGPWRVGLTPADLEVELGIGIRATWGTVIETDPMDGTKPGSGALICVVQDPLNVALITQAPELVDAVREYLLGFGQSVLQRSRLQQILDRIDGIIQ